MQRFTDTVDRMAAEIDAAIRRELDRALADAPERDHAAVRRIYQSIYAYLANGGRRMHAISIVLAFRAADGSPAPAIMPVAVGFQLYHHHTLVHDDIYDEDEMRRGSPTIPRAFASWCATAHGATPAAWTDGRVHLFHGPLERLGAIGGWVQGKIVHALAFDAIAQAPFPADRLIDVVRALHRHDLFDNAGQLKDVFHEGAAVPDARGCLAIARLKTGQLFAVGVDAAARLASATPAQRAALTAWIVPVATAYQLQDDLEDLEIESEKGQGRGVGGDLRAVKPTFLLGWALEHGSPAAARELRGRLLDSNGEPDTFARIRDLLESTGALRACRAKVRELVDEGIAALGAADPPLDPEQTARMAEFGHYFVSPEYWKRRVPPPLDPMHLSAAEA